MESEHFDLNDIHHKPTDQQLDALMALVAAERAGVPTLPVRNLWRD